jgi:hypothetical protein
MKYGAEEGCWTDRVKNEVVYSQGGQKHPIYHKGRKTKWNGRVLHRNCLLKHDVDRKKHNRDGKTRKKTEAAA